MERQRARRLAAQQVSDPGRLLGGRAVWWVFGGAAAAFLLGLSLAWGNGAQLALLVGFAAGIGWLALWIGFAWWRRKARLGGRADARAGSASRR